MPSTKSNNGDHRPTGHASTKEYRNDVEVDALQCNCRRRNAKERSLLVRTGKSGVGIFDGEIAELPDNLGMYFLGEKRRD